MILNPSVKCLTLNIKKLLNSKKNLEIVLMKISICNFGTSNVFYENKKKSKKRRWFWSRKKIDDINNKMPILEPLCKIGMIIGGSKGFGFAAADELLSKGAQRVVIADKDKERGDRAVQRLCDAYGKDRASFIQCDIRDPTLLEASFSEVICRHKAIHILFSDLDENQTPSIKNQIPSICGETDNNDWSNTRKASMIGLKYMGKKNGGKGGVIINCASILGFMDWPQNPSPVYCKKEPIIEVTRSIAEEHPVDKSGVRFVALCPTNRPFEKISLPDFPQTENKNECTVECIPPRKKTVGLALTHVMAWGQTGSTWVVPPFPSLYELPKLIHFPKNPDELIKPEVYEKKNCPVPLNSHCAEILKETPKSKYKMFFSRKRK